MCMARGSRSASSGHGCESSPATPCSPPVAPWSSRTRSRSPAASSSIHPRNVACRTGSRDRVPSGWSGATLRPGRRRVAPVRRAHSQSGPTTVRSAALQRLAPSSLPAALARGAVALAVDRQNMRGPLGVLLELLAEPEHVGVHGPRRGEALVAPHLVEEPLPRQDLPAVLDQIAQEVELLARQADLGPGAEHLAGAQVETGVGELNPVHSLAGAGAPEHRAHPGQQLPQRERLRDVVVGAELKPEDAVRLLAPRG